MKKLKTGWVVVNPQINHIACETFASLKKDAIKKFIERSGGSWQHHRRKYKIECVRADQVITADLEQN